MDFLEACEGDVEDSLSFEISLLGFEVMSTPSILSLLMDSQVIPSSG